LHRLIDTTLPEPGPVQVQLIVPFSLRERLGSCRRSDSMTDPPPEMRPVQNAGSLRKVSSLLGLDPLGSISDDHHWASRVLPHLLHRGGLLPKLMRRAKGCHIAPPG
jgi:hypothetical protein